MFISGTFSAVMTLVAQETNTVAALEPRFARRESNVIERYEGTCIDVSILLYRNEDERRDRLTFTAGPRVRMKQDVEELLFRAYSLSRQVHLTFESGRDRSLCLQMVYGVIAGIFKELDRAEATRAAARSARVHAAQVPRAGLCAGRELLPAGGTTARADALPGGRDAG